MAEVVKRGTGNATAVLFAREGASDESRWISGVVLNVDGGLFVGSPLSMLGNLEE